MNPDWRIKASKPKKNSVYTAEFSLKETMQFLNKLATATPEQRAEIRKVFNKIN